MDDSAPENTQAAFEGALVQGMAVEMDIQRTVDDHLVVIHDPTVDRTTDGSGETVVLRPIVTPDFMTERFCELPMDFVRMVATKIGNLDGVDAVCYDVTHKPPATVEWE